MTLPVGPPSEPAARAVDHTSFQTRTFLPAPWARGPHAQTLAARFLRRPWAGTAPACERLETPDGDFLDLEWWAEPTTDAPLALVLHGLEGSARRRYVLSVCRELLARGVRPVALNFRGCSGEPNRALRFYHSGETEDPAWVLSILRERYPGRPVGAFAFSLGGNMLLKLMGERADGGRGLVDAAVAMSVPYDLAAGSLHLERTRMGAFYTLYFTRQLKRKVRLKRELLHGSIDLARAEAARTLREFDDVVTAPLHGFSDAADYYARSSCSAYLGGVGVPTLLLQSRDDPFLPPEALPLEAMVRNPWLVPRMTSLGGHVGFLSGGPRRPRFWADEEGARFLAIALAGSPDGGPHVGREGFLDGTPVFP